MSKFEFFLPLAKIDLDQRMVYGVATAEAPDRSGEICDYASSKPLFEKWSAEAVAASGGKSLGAVRAMHGRVAAGKITDMTFDDEGKRIRVAAKIVDEDEWLKVAEGVYTGFSQGGRYVKRWPDPESGLTRYTAEPHEISLVDLPCLPDATFEVVKGGVVEKRAFAAAAAAADGSAALEPAATSGATEAADADAAEESTKHAPEDAPPTSPAEAAAAALVKAASALSQAADKIARAVAENAALRKEVGEIAPSLADLAKRVGALEAQPLPAKAALRAATKSADGEGQSATAVEEAVRRIAGLPAHERALALTKLSLANPAPLRF